MTQLLTDSIYTVSRRIYDLCVTNATLLGLDAGADPGKTNVWYGDQEGLPHTPALCIEPGTKRRNLAGAPELTSNTIDVHMLLYHSVVSIGQEQSRMDCIQFAEAVEQWLHINHLNMANSNGDQIIIHGFVTESDPGYVVKTGTLYNAVRMTWSGLTKTSLRNPLNPPV